MTVKVNNNKLEISGKVLDNYEVLNQLPSGANGMVYIVKNLLLDREEVLKVWLKLRKNDPRDKLKQGIKEAQKQSNLSGNNYVAQIYTLEFINDIAYATMEYVKGITLKEYYEKNKDTENMLSIAYKYLEAIIVITKKDIFHGDPHWGNVIVYKEIRNTFNGPETNIKFIDFGTSYFSGKVFSQNRHWRLVEETIVNLTKHFNSSDYMKQTLNTFRNTCKEMTQDLEKKPDLFNDIEIAQMRTAMIQDYLSGLTDFEIRMKK